MKDTEITEKFEEIYKSKIEPNIRKLESYRLEQKKKYDLFSLIGNIFVVIAIISIIVIATKAPTQADAWELSPKLAAVFFVISVITCFFNVTKQNKISNDFRKAIKPTLLKAILSIFGNFRYTENELLSLKEIKSTGLYCNAETKTDDDNIIGTYKKDIPITLIETKLTNSGNGKEAIIVFRGLILKIKMNKSFEGITIGYRKENNGIFDKLAKNTVTRKLEKINLEDPEFSRNYSIYSDNQVESRYLLSPSFMEKIKNIQRVFLVNSVNFVFKDEFIYLFLDGFVGPTELRTRLMENCSHENGFFEVGNINNTLTDKKIYLKLFKELVSIFSLVNYFKLNEKTGL